MVENLTNFTKKEKAMKMLLDARKKLPNLFETPSKAEMIKNKNTEKENAPNLHENLKFLHLSVDCPQFFSSAQLTELLKQDGFFAKEVSYYDFMFDSLVIKRDDFLQKFDIKNARIAEKEVQDLLLEKNNVMQKIVEESKKINRLQDEMNENYNFLMQCVKSENYDEALMEKLQCIDAEVAKNLGKQLEIDMLK